MQEDRRDTEAQEWVPTLGRWGIQKQDNFFAFTVKSGPALNLYTDTEEGMKQLVKRERKRLEVTATEE